MLLKTKYLLPLLFFIIIIGITTAQTATVRGIILDEQLQPLAGVNITFGNDGALTNLDGSYILEIPADESVVITFTYLGFKNVQLTLTLTPNEDYEFNPSMKTDVEQIGTVVLDAKRRKRVEGLTSISPEAIRKIPTANSGVTSLLNSLPGVFINDELSTQYNVRGGNFDENLIYVNEIEVYRPFLVRSGQQEGLSFVNSDLTRSVDFSSGGFQPKFGDKLSSVLDITYRKPTNFEASADLSLLGANVSIGGISKNGRFTSLAGLRYRDNSLFVNSKQTEINFFPVFADVQTYLTYKVSNKFELGFLGNIAINDYSYEPITRQTNFGTLADPIALLIFYEGQEEDRYDTYFGAIKASYKVSDNYTAKFIGSVYQTQEQEYFDILAEYRLGTPNSDIGGENLGEVEFTEGIGAQFTHARNDLDALIINIEHKGNVTLDGSSIEYGIKYTHEDIRDRLQEFEIIDSAGFSIRPPLADFINDQPYDPFTAPIEPFTKIRATNKVKIDRLSGYVQWSKRISVGESDLWLNAGTRVHNWTVSGENIVSNTQTVFSPRAQIALKPDWDMDMLFRLSGGFYHQPPFYRELRDMTGTVIPTVKAQQSVHIVLGNDYSFNLWKRPFILITEAYYKNLTDVNTYTLENVRIRYRANNNAVAFAYGLETRLAGEFVPGTESWISIGYLKTEENQDNRGYIFRPTDQRLKVGVLFQDYVKAIPDLKLYLNLTYQTGLPAGSPSFADPYDFQTRLRDYRRVDIGTSYVIVGQHKLRDKGFLRHFKELTIGVEIFNIFDVRNSITSTFVRDVNTKQQFSIPNFLTPRVFNVRLTSRF